MSEPYKVKEYYKIGRYTYKPLFPDLFPPSPDAEYEELLASIKTHGIEVPILLDEKGGIIDGINRCRAAEQLGLSDVPTRTLHDLSYEQKLALAEHVNIFRRHLTPEGKKAAQIAQIKRICERRKKGESTRAIAKAEGVDPKTVRNVLDRESGGESSPPTPDGGTVTGSDGKTYQAKRADKPKSEQPASQAASQDAADGEEKPAPATADSAAPTDEPADCEVDCRKRPLPERLLPAFEERKKLLAYSRRIKGMIDELEGFASGAARIDRRLLIGKLKDVHDSIVANVPYAICPDCQGAGCQGDRTNCRGHGWILKVTYDFLPPEKKSA